MILRGTSIKFLFVIQYGFSMKAEKYLDIMFLDIKNTVHTIFV